jgi:hypothetical protein
MEPYSYKNTKLKVGHKIIARPTNRNCNNLIYNRLVVKGMDLDWKEYTIQQTTLNHLWLKGVDWAVQDTSRYRKESAPSDLIEIQKVL